MLIPLSYPLSLTTPLYQNTPLPSFSPHKSICRGDSTNSNIITFTNHVSTHIDLPLHFCDKGNAIIDLLTAETLFSPTFCLNIPKSDRDSIHPDDFQQFLPMIQNAEAILVRTGTCSLRGTSQYANNYPYIDDGVPLFLRENLPRLKLFGVDTLSVSNPSFKEIGRRCHRNFLCNSPPIMILEDANLTSMELLKKPGILRLYPWILDKLDATPVVAIFETPSPDKVTR
jgi:arylformamidase